MVGQFRTGEKKGGKFFYGYVVTAAGFMIMLVGGGTYTPSFGVFLRPIVEEFGWPRAQASLEYSLSVLVQGILAIGMGRLTDKLGPRLILGLFAKELWMIYLFSFIFGVGWGNQAVLRYSLTSEVFGLGSIGLILGLMAVGEALAAAFGSYFAGYLFDVLGNYRAVFWMGIVISLLGALLVGLLKPTVREKR
jgi:MFS family permease